MINEYILEGINDIIYDTNINYVRTIVDFNKLPINILTKVYSYLVFGKKLNNNEELKSLIKNKKYNIEISPYLSDDKKYHIFGLFGLMYIFSIKKVKNEIPFYDDMISELTDISELTGNDTEDIKSYIDFNNKLLDYNSPTKNMFSVFVITFKKEIYNFNKIYLNKFYI